MVSEVAGSSPVFHPYINFINFMKLRRYETLFILTPLLSEDKIKNYINKFRDFLKLKGCNIIAEESLGLKKLAYPIQNKTTGFYQVFEFESTPETIFSLETEYKREEVVIRFLTILLNKYGIEYNKHKRSFK